MDSVGKESIDEPSLVDDRNAPSPNSPKLEARVTEITSLLLSLNEAANESGRSQVNPHTPHENQLVQVRLGIARGLFTALRSKDPPTAAHSLRVALGCSAWALAIGLSDQECDAIEVAALLHDIGKIGVPDHILQKPGKLSVDEQEIVAHHSQMGIEVLETLCASREILDIVRCGPAWYDGSRPGFECQGTAIPFGARMLAIVDAFDAMTTDRVYRRAWSLERAQAELFQFAGTQFDPQLVKQFVEVHARDAAQLYTNVGRRWLESLGPETSNAQWRLGESTRPAGEPLTPDALFEQKLLNNMHDGVVFVDSQMQIFLWNRGAERLTGIPGSAVYRRGWSPALLNLRDHERRVVRGEACPVAHAMKTGVQSQQRVMIPNRNGHYTSLDMHVMPVVGNDGATFGATLVLHDVSPEASLEERCQSLHDRATKDPLTGVANRAEFDRMHKLFIEAHLETKLPCSLIVCDIDFFKRVNDQYGHQAGDEAIKSLAKLLSSKCQPGDLVARYGGEEFVILCADCNNAVVAQRAEQFRRELAGLRQPVLGSGHITASFGVTELQPGDTPETMFRRADRALLQAKEMGRNLVVQLGTGMSTEEHKRTWWPFTKPEPNMLFETRLVTVVPIGVAIEKLRGFVADHDAQIESVGSEHIKLTIEDHNAPESSRNNRPLMFLLEIEFSESYQQPNASHSLGNIVHTNVDVVMRPKRFRNLREENASERARQVLASLKSYLMAEVESEAQKSGMLKKAKRAFVPWLKKS